VWSLILKIRADEPASLGAGIEYGKWWTKRIAADTPGGILLNAIVIALAVDVRSHLRGAVVDRFICRRWIFYSEIASEIAPEHEILGLSDRAAIFETWRDGVVAAAIDADPAAVVEGVGLGLGLRWRSTVIGHRDSRQKWPC
jgi:hypothetical protein